MTVDDRGNSTMMCEACGKRPATVHLTQMVNNEVKKLHLCEICAAEHGLDVNGAISITDVLLGLGGAGEKEELADKACPHCRMRLEDFRKSSRLGCQHCYEAFAAELAPLLEAMHRGAQHVGKQPAGAGTAPAAASLLELRKELQAAVKAENYETAARIRDRIRDLENAGRRPAPGAEPSAV